MGLLPHNVRKGQWKESDEPARRMNRPQHLVGAWKARTKRRIRHAIVDDEDATSMASHPRVKSPRPGRQMFNVEALATAISEDSFAAQPGSTPNKRLQARIAQREMP